MLPTIDLPRAVYRGRYMAAVARMERTGTPIDVAKLEAFREHWNLIRGRIVAEIDRDFGVFVPTGRSLNADRLVDAEILRMALDHRIDEYALADAVDHVWRESKSAPSELREAIAAARTATGLTAKRIRDWENAGRDHSSWPGLDVTARELAHEYPGLGFGRGYESPSSFDDTDYAALLWERLRDELPPVPKRGDSKVLAQAVQLVEESGPNHQAERLTFSSQKFGEWLARNEIPWPRLASGGLDLSDDTFRQMARAYPVVAPLRELRHTLGQMRLNDLAVGQDGRNRCLLSPFQASTSRNQPSNSRFIFGPSCWLRGLIRPERGRALAYLDYSQQEFAIAAALSGDLAMQAAYQSGDPYLEFAKQAGRVPLDGTKQTHRQERELFKTCVLAVQYGMGRESLAVRIGQAPAYAQELLRLHRKTYPRYWTWSDGAVNHGLLHGSIDTVFGWRLHVGPDVNPRGLANFGCQANGAEMLRLACCLTTERGINVCCPIHDALLVEGPDDEIEAVVWQTQEAMREASEVVLGGFAVRTEVKIVRYPDRYMDERGATMWDRIEGILADLERSEEDLETCWNLPPVGVAFSDRYL